MDWFPVAGKTFVVLGLARSGLAVIDWLKCHGAHVLAYDDSLEKRENVRQLGIEVLDDVLSFKSQRNISAVVQSPGVPFSYPQPHLITAEAIAQEIPIISDISLFRRAHSKNRFIGVTGTNGKSTTSSLIKHILEQCGFEVAVGGNIGIPALSLPELSEEGIYVLELSSYQLDVSTDLDLDAAVWLNISEDHLDRHGTMERYVQAKSNIFLGMTQSKIAVVGVDDLPSLTVYESLKKTELVRAIPISVEPDNPEDTYPKESILRHDYYTATVEFVKNHGQGNIIPVSVERVIHGGIYLQDSTLIDDCATSTVESIMDCRDLPTLLGQHNWQNTAVAYALARSWGCSVEDIVDALKTFPGLPHRQEHVATLQNVSFINDSKATNAEATAKALAVFEEIYWIVGGQPKHVGIGSLAPYFSKIKRAFLIGQAQDQFSKTLEGIVPYQRCSDLEEATREAYKQASAAAPTESPVVLLSPACASFDQFRDFEHRGDTFREVVLSLNSHNIGGRT